MSSTSTPLDAGPAGSARADRAFLGHPAGLGWLAISYAANAFAFGDLFTPAGQASLYWPRFWRVPSASLPRPR